jgi:penicillin-binding protein 1A
MIEKLATSWNIPSHLLSGPYRLAPSGLRQAVARGALAGGLVLALTGVGIGAVFWSYGRDLPDATQLAQYRPPTVKRVDAQGRVIEERKFVALNDIPAPIVKAFLAAEDEHFYDHVGVSPPGVLRSFAQTAAGISRGGGSTITQQVAKNLLLTSVGRSIGRKIREVIRARRIEAALTKDEILEIYLNQIYLGGSEYGVAAAAQTYFGRPLSRLTVAQAAYLAALPKAPAHYRLDRAGNRERAKDRRDWVLGRMASDGLITPTAAYLARGEPLDAPDRTSTTT